MSISTVDSTEEGPCHLLPNELLSLIFEEGSLLAYPAFKELKSPYTSLLPDNECPFMSTVMRVCHRWRQIAIHTPALWTSIHISSCSRNLISHLSEYHRQTEWVNLHLQRSQSLPLDITLSSPAAKYIIRHLEPVCHRLRSLNIIVPTAQSLAPVLSTLRNMSAPILEILEISAEKFHEGVSAEALAIWRPFFTGGTPKLTHVRLVRVNAHLYSAPFTGLTTLELHFIIWPSHLGLREMLAESPALENLVLHIDNSSSLRLDGASRASIPLPNLHTLEVRAWYSTLQDNLCSLFQLFSTPSLEALALKGISAQEWCRLIVYFRMYAANYPHLHSLTLANIKSLMFVDSGAVRAFPHLTHLSLTDIYSTAFCQLLLAERTDDGYQVPVWPHLTSMHIVKDREFKAPLLQAAVSARRDIGKPITRLALDQKLLDGVPDAADWLAQHTALQRI